jgi:hypothetical protein
VEGFGMLQAGRGLEAQARLMLLEERWRTSICAVQNILNGAMHLQSKS